MTVLGTLILALSMLLVQTRAANPEFTVVVSVQRPVPVLFLRQTLESMSKLIGDPDYQLFGPAGFGEFRCCSAVSAPARGFTPPLQTRPCFWFLQFDPNRQCGFSHICKVILVPIGDLGYEREFEFQRLLQAKEYKDKVLVMPSVTDEKHATALNRAASMALGRYIVFMESFIELVNTNIVSNMANIIKTLPGVGVVGAKILFPDETIYHFGIELVFEPDTWNWGVKGKNYLGISYSLQGYSSMHALSLARTEVVGTSKALMMVEASVFREAGKFDEKYASNIFIDTDLCFRISALGKKIVVEPTAVAVHNNKDVVLGEITYENDITRNDLVKFSTIWKTQFDEKLANLAISNFTLVWNMECGSGQVLGFTAEAIHFAMSLYNKIMLRVEVGMGREKECYEEIVNLGYPFYVTKALNRMMHNTLSEDQSTDVALVIHRDPGRYSWFFTSHMQRKNYYVIGRSMYETDGIPRDWVPACNSNEIDEIWVPTDFNFNTFKTAGVNASKLSVVPELTDTYHFDPKSHAPLLPRTQDTYTFLSILKWEERKAWKTLLRSYFDEFKGHDNVRLVILSRMNDESENSYKSFIESYLNETKTSGDNVVLPMVKFINHFVPYSLLPALYSSADAFVLASHGEGWGLPLMEAMAMKKPTVGTNWGGNLAFMTPYNSLLVEVSGMEESPQKWATPSSTSLKSILRSLVDHSNDKLGLLTFQARSDIVDKFSYPAVSSLIIEKLKAIKAKLPEVRKSKNAAPVTSWRSWSDNHRKNPTTTVPTPVVHSPQEPTFTDDKGIVRYRAKIIND